MPTYTAPLPIEDLPRGETRVHTAFDLEAALVRFLTVLYRGARLDNPTLNLSQATSPQLDIVRGPDEPPVSYDPTLRAQTLALKQPPRVVRGRIPRTVTGEIDANRLPDVPNVIVQAVKGKIEVDETIVTARICFTVYDENPDSQGYQDVLNMMEAAAIALCSFGQAALEQAYPIVLPIDWTIPEVDTFPHFIGEMTTMWELPSGRPMPDLGGNFIPGEHLETQVTEEVPVTL
jgi:hypothetical protein